MTMRVLGGVIAAMAMAAVASVGTAEAAPKEWDIGQYDSCTDRVAIAYMAGDISDANYIDALHQCCRISGGEWDTGSGPNGNCGAPPAIVAPTASEVPENAPEESTGTAPPTKPTKTKLIPAPMIPLPGVS